MYWHLLPQVGGGDGDGGDVGGGDGGDGGDGEQSFVIKNNVRSKIIMKS